MVAPRLTVVVRHGFGEAVAAMVVDFSATADASGGQLLATQVLTDGTVLAQVRGMPE